MAGLPEGSPERLRHVLRKDAIDRRLACCIIESELADDISEVVPPDAETGERPVFDSRDCPTVKRLSVRWVKNVVCGSSHDATSCHLSGSLQMR